MPCLSTQLTAKGQFLINIFIIDTRKSQNKNKVDIFKNLKTHTALIDTGATRSCITEEVAEELELIPTCKNKMYTAGKPIECNGYDIEIAIPITEVKEFEVAKDKQNKKRVVPKSGTTHIRAWKSSVSSLPSQGKYRGYDCLLGMDVLASCTFQYNGGRFTICL